MYTEHEYLAHSGVKGMKWGIRRYRNEDGTLTDAGKKRYSKLDKYSKAAYKSGLADKKNLNEQIIKKYSKFLSKREIDRVSNECAEIGLKMQKKIRDIDKKELNKGLDFYEHRVATAGIRGAFIGAAVGTGVTAASPLPKTAIPITAYMSGIAGAMIGMSISSFKNRASKKERDDVEEEYSKKIVDAYVKAIGKAYGKKTKNIKKDILSDINTYKQNTAMESGRQAQQQQLMMNQHLQIHQQNMYLHQQTVQQHLMTQQMHNQMHLQSQMHLQMHHPGF